MSAGNEELQALSEQLQEVESRLESLQAEHQQLRRQQEDISDAIEAIETLDSGSTVQVPLGGGAFVRASIEEMDELIVSIGGGYAAERTASEAVELLSERQDLIEARMEELSEAIGELKSKGEELGQQAQQQLQQRQGGGQGGLGPGAGRPDRNG